MSIFKIKEVGMLRRILQCGLFFCLVSVNFLGADFYSARGRCRVDVGYRQDDFDWSIAGTNGTPNILSELKWKKLEMLQASCLGWHTDFLCYVPYIRWYGAYSKIMRGHVSDRDYSQDHRRCEFSRARAKCNRGTVGDLSGALGLPWGVNWYGYMQFTPVAGISWHQQHLHMHEGTQEMEWGHSSEEGSIDNLHSTYKTTWWGPWIGIDALWEVDVRWAWTGSVEYHLSTRYHAEGHWNLRPEFIGGFHHSAIGDGFVWRLGLQFAFNCFWLFSADFSAQRWSTRHGVDTTNVKATLIDENGCKDTRHQLIKTPFNGAHWKSYSISGGLVYRY
jgi:hypothetical protein